MEKNLLIQYIIIAVIVISSGFSLFKIIKKNFASKKFKDDKSGCDSNCGCS